MSKTAAELAERLNRVATRLELRVVKAESLYRSSHLNAEDVEFVYGSAYVQFAAQLEAILEDLFMGLLTGSVVMPRAQAVSRVPFKSSVVAKDVVYGGRAYLDWLPYDRTRDRAKLFFRAGRPFSNVSSAAAESFNRVPVLRNALAHSSTSSFSKFSTRFVDGKQLPPSQRKPAGYLRGSHAKGQSRINYQMAEAISAFREITR